MCLHVRSASSGPRERDSSFTLENSSLRGETEGGHSSDQRPGQDGSGRELCGTLLAGHDVQCPNVRSGFRLRNRSRLSGHPTERGRPKAGPEGGGGGGQGLRSSRGRIRPCRSLTTTAMPAQRRHGWSGEASERLISLRTRGFTKRAPFRAQPTYLQNLKNPSKVNFGLFTKLHAM